MRDHDEPVTGASRPVAAPRCSVVVPAHDEQAVIASGLRLMTEQLRPGEVDVVVVANGCSDATAAEASGVPGVRVVEVARASKTGALNAGDDAALGASRVYVDADVRLTTEALREVVEALQTDRAVVAGLRPRFDVSRSSWAVRQFYAVFEQLPYVRDGLVGLGVYGLSEAGHRRLGRFPDVTADDLLVQRLFSPGERLLVDAEFVVAAPRTLGALLAVRRRIARGNHELARAAGLSADRPPLDQRSTGRQTSAALLRLLARRPRLVPAALVYLAVTLRARRAAAASPPAAVWERDRTSRVAVSG